MNNTAINHIENDYPFYNDIPVSISTRAWLVLLVMVAVGFAALVSPFILFENRILQFIPAILFFAIPLSTLIVLVPGHWRAIFRKFRLSDLLRVLLFTILCLMMSLASGAVVMKVFGASSNPAIFDLVNLSSSDQLLFYLRTIPQLFGEELLTILPFLALMRFFFHRLKFTRKLSSVAALLFSSLLFSLAHLPTYDWNILQCVAVIGTARVALTLSYMVTKNIWVSFGTHVLNDWTLFTISLVFAGEVQT